MYGNNNIRRLKLYYFGVLLVLAPYYMDGQVIVTKDVDYIESTNYDNGQDLLDIYMPTNPKNVPVIVYFHGGALLGGDKSSAKNIGFRVAESMIGLVSANYRVSPHFHYPAHINDAAAATDWVFKNISAYGGDPNKIYVCGHSAGAYLAALLAVNSSLLTTLDKADLNIAGAILISPFLYVEETAKARIAQDSIFLTVWGSDPQDWVQASVSPHIGPNRDNILLIYADGDDAWRKEQNERFARAMADMGNQNVFTREVPHRTHGSLISAILEKDDEIIGLIKGFIFDNN